MDKLPFRQVHLDFHTGQYMPGVGSKFSEEDFEKALKEGHINSITLFSKCHHGWSYHPTKVNKMHPSLDTDLLGRQLQVCKKLGVRAQIYISAGLDERMANSHPQYLVNCVDWGNNMLGAYFHPICLNNDEYLNILKAETEEVMEKFEGLYDGLFYDICSPIPCICSYCIGDMLDKGMNPENPDDVNKHADMTYHKFTKAITETVRKHDKNMPIFFNCGNVPRNDRSVVETNSAHLELESLPTGGWGYDHFPMSASYARLLGKEYLGMTGKFHKTWGEFGGFKHPNALIYETSLSLAFGAKCSIGDQLHPLGFFDHATYKLIGKAYELVEKKEEYCRDVEAVSDIAVYSAYEKREDPSCPDIGASRMLLEGHYLFDIIDNLIPFEKYKLIIFPDRIKFDSALTERVNKYLENGGKILLSNLSGLNEDNKFFKDFGVKFIGENPHDNTYFVPNYELFPNGITDYLMYNRGQYISVDSSVEVLGNMQNSYFNRTLRRFCSHSTTPYNPDEKFPAVVINKNIGYIAWNVFTQYGDHGAFHLKQMTLDLIDKLLGESKTLNTNLPSNGVSTLMYQKDKNRYISHILYAVTKLRGNTEVIEDAIEICDTEVSIRLDKKPESVVRIPENVPIDFTYENNTLFFKIDKFSLHSMAVINM